MTTIRYNLQKWHHLMSFKDNGTLLKQHMAITLPEIEKLDTQKTWCFTKMAYLAKKYPRIICQGLRSMIFKRKFLNLLYDSDSWSWEFKVKFLLRGDIPNSLMCLTVCVSSISRMFVMHVVRCHLCWVPFL